MTRTVIVAVAVWLSTGAVGCKTHEELAVDVVCASVCPCVGDPDDVAECNAECANALDPGDVDDVCLECVLEAGESCVSLVACDAVCPF